MMFSNIVKDKYLRVVSVISFLILFLTALIFYLAVGSVKTSLIIHFNADEGTIDFFGSRGQVFGILLSTLVIILVNLFLSNFLYTRERFLSYIFAFSTLMLTILILIAISVIISVN